MTRSRRTARVVTIIVVVVTMGCAVGIATVRPDGSCEARGVAAGRSQIAAYQQRGEPENAQRTPASSACAALRGGTGSSDLWDTVAAVVGGLIGWLAGGGP